MADDKKKAAPENLTPTQAEADEFKTKLVGGTVAEREAPAQREVHPPTPTQAENDAAKLGAMPAETPPEPPPSETPPVSAPTPNRKQVEASQPSAGYQTRAATTAPAKED
jgi:hypothetical protein